MATLINGARVEFAGYEFAVNDGDDMHICLNYDVAKRIARHSGHAIFMRALYQTEWMIASEDS